MPLCVAPGAFFKDVIFHKKTLFSTSVFSQQKNVVLWCGFWGLRAEKGPVARMACVFHACSSRCGLGALKKCPWRGFGALFRRGVFLGAILKLLGRRLSVLVPVWPTPCGCVLRRCRLQKPRVLGHPARKPPKMALRGDAAQTP
jgi:hypothetical protein